MNIEQILAEIKAGNMSLYTARQSAQAAGLYNDAVEKQLKAAHEATMTDVCKHQTRMAGVARRGW